MAQLNPVSVKIREKYGTVTHFCKLKNINVHTFKVVISGYGKSSKIEKILKDEGILIPEKKNMK